MSTYDSFCFYLKNALIKRFYHSQSYSCSHRNYFLLSCRLLFWCKNRCIIDQASNYSRCGSAAWNALPCDTCSKIGANISFEAFWRNCGQLFRKNVVFFFFFFSFLPHHFQRWGFRVLYDLASFLCCLGDYYHFGVKWCTGITIVLR